MGGRDVRMGGLGYLGSFQFSGPQKYSFVHVYWPKKQQAFRRGCGGGSPHIKKNS